MLERSELTKNSLSGCKLARNNALHQVADETTLIVSFLGLVARLGSH
jgi:hypothetical protein